MINIANPVRLLKMPNGDEFEFFGKTYYGVCSTSASAQAKTVTIPAITSGSLIDGKRVVVRFTNSQSYDGTPTLNVSSTGAKNIQSAVGINASKSEWGSGAIIGFVYNNGCWVIENGQHAGTGIFGKVRLGGYSYNDGTYAATTSTVMSLGNNIFDSGYYNYPNSYCETIIDTTMPDVNEWTSNNGSSRIEFSNISWLTRNEGAYDYNRIIKITYGSSVIYKPIMLSSYYQSNDVIEVWFTFDNYNSYYMVWDPNNNTLSLLVPTSVAGAYKFKVEFFYYHDAGFVPYPIFRDTLSNYLTLADLPIYDGTVV